jgi:hypothetical protein
MTRRRLIGLIPFAALGAAPKVKSDSLEFNASEQTMAWLGVIDGNRFFTKFRARSPKDLERIVNSNTYTRNGILVVHPGVYMDLVATKHPKLSIGQRLYHDYSPKTVAEGVPTFCGVPVYLSFKVNRHNEAIKDVAKLLGWDRTDL